MYFTISNKSHLCNPADRFVTRWLHIAVRSPSRRREIRRPVNVHDKAVPPRTGVDKSCKVVKCLLLQWISRCYQDSHTQMLVASLFKIILEQIPQNDSIDDIDIPRGVIYMPLPLMPLAHALDAVEEAFADALHSNEEDVDEAADDPILGGRSRCAFVPGSLQIWYG